MTRFLDRLITRSACLLVCALGSCTYAAADTTQAPSLTPALGQPVASFTLPDIHGRARSLDEISGQVVVLAFLGTECPLAKNYAPRLRDLAAEFADQGVAFLGIYSNLQDSLTEITTFARTHGLTFPQLKDNNNAVADQLGAQRTPEVFLLDRQRVLRYWGRIDDQYGFQTGGNYAKPKLSKAFLADAIREVVADRPVPLPTAKSVGCLIGRVTRAEPQGDVTYSKQISRIFQQHCVECHRAGELAPFAMTSYDELVGWAEMIREVIDEGRMPPWFADPKHGRFSNDPRLSEEEKQQVRAWVKNGCPQGDPKDLPAPFPLAEGWRLGQPDQIVYMDKPFTVPAEGVVEYQFFTVDPKWTTDKWIQATELRPGNPSVVHHLRADIEPVNLSEEYPASIGFYGPGFNPYVCPPGTAFHVPPGSKIVFAMHYTSNGKEQSDRSMIGIKFADPRTVKKIILADHADTKTIRIKPGEADHRIKVARRFYQDTLLLSMLPHMHLRGRSFRYEAEYPNGSREILLDIPNYDPSWQLRYILAEPKLLPRGTILHCSARFDNSADNPANPDPTQVVNFGEQTWDEMMEGMFTAVDNEQDVAALALTALSVATGGQPSPQPPQATTPEKESPEKESPDPQR